MKVPPGVSPQDFSDALKQFEDIVGEDWVFTSDQDVAMYRDAYSPFYGEEDELVASAAVAPDNVEDVQKIVKVANTYKIPIYAISTGKNLGYGGSAPAYSGSVVLDLKRMNRILEVNEKSAYALVEPGVSYFDLYRYIQEKGLKLWVDVPDPGWGSPVGNSLDRGGGYLYKEYRNHFDSHCGMEIVLANGELLRTGMGAMPGAKTWQQYKSGFGPWIDGIFSQSNFGVHNPKWDSGCFPRRIPTSPTSPCRATTTSLRSLKLWIISRILAPHRECPSWAALCLRADLSVKVARCRIRN